MHNYYKITKNGISEIIAQIKEIPESQRALLIDTAKVSFNFAKYIIGGSASGLVKSALQTTYVKDMAEAYLGKEAVYILSAAAISAPIAFSVVATGGASTPLIIFSLLEAGELSIDIASDAGYLESNKMLEEYNHPVLKMAKVSINIYNAIIEEDSNEILHGAKILGNIAYEAKTAYDLYKSIDFTSFPDIKNLLEFTHLLEDSFNSDFYPHEHIPLHLDLTLNPHEHGEMIHPAIYT